MDFRRRGRERAEAHDDRGHGDRRASGPPRLDTAGAAGSREAGRARTQSHAGRPTIDLRARVDRPLPQGGPEGHGRASPSRPASDAHDNEASGGAWTGREGPREEWQRAGGHEWWHGWRGGWESSGTATNQFRWGTSGSADDDGNEWATAAWWADAGHSTMQESWYYAGRRQ